LNTNVSTEEIFKHFEKFIERLESKDFKNHFEHVIIEGGHTAPIERFDLVFGFFEETFPAE